MARWELCQTSISDTAEPPLAAWPASPKFPAQTRKTKVRRASPLPPEGRSLHLLPRPVVGVHGPRHRPGLPGARRELSRHPGRARRLPVHRRRDVSPRGRRRLHGLRGRAAHAAPGHRDGEPGPGCQQCGHRRAHGAAGRHPGDPARRADPQGGLAQGGLPGDRLPADVRIDREMGGRGDRSPQAGGGGVQGHPHRHQRDAGPGRAGRAGRHPAAACTPARMAGRQRWRQCTDRGRRGTGERSAAPGETAVDHRRWRARRAGRPRGAAGAGRALRDPGGGVLPPPRHLSQPAPLVRR